MEITKVVIEQNTKFSWRRKKKLRFGFDFSYKRSSDDWKYVVDALAEWLRRCPAKAVGFPA